MILTLTGNLLAERTFEFPDGWREGKTQRAVRESFQVGGKGVNVAKMLARLGARSLAACFVGGATGDECVAWLRAHGIEHHVFRTSASTRAGVVVRTPANAQAETTFLGPDVPPDAAAFSAGAAWLDAQPVTHTLAFCGSFPGWDAAGAAPLRNAIARRIAHNNVFVDTYGPPLAWFARHPVAMVKINRHEFDQLCAHANSAPLCAGNMAARLSAACEHWPVRRWIVTDGAGPVWFATKGDSAAPSSLQPPQIREISATGSGDVLFAVILHKLINQNFALAAALPEAIACASANASNNGIAEINKN